MKTKELFVSYFVLFVLMFNAGCFVCYKGVADKQGINLIQDSLLKADIWEAVSTSTHNFNTDLCFWKNEFYLIYQNSEYHLFSPKSKLVLLKSRNCKNWTLVKEFLSKDYELRDPKFAKINNKLFIYALPNLEISPTPFTTVFTFSSDGIEWKEFEETDEHGWLFWRPRTFNDKVWYVSAYWNEHGKCALFKTVDGIKWEFVSMIYEGEHCDETALEFTSQGDMYITSRLEGDLNWDGGSFTASTLIAKASYSFTEWKYKKTHTTRLDGPVLWRHDSLIFAAGRYEPDIQISSFGMGSIFNVKRTAIYLLVEDSLVLLKVLPSGGDTSYPGIAEKDGEIYMSYYTNDPNIECTWSVGCFLPTKIMMAKFQIDDLKTAALINSDLINNLSITVNVK